MKVIHKKIKRRWRICISLFLVLCIGAGNISVYAVNNSDEKKKVSDSIISAITHFYPFDGETSDWVKEGVAGLAFGNVVYEEGKFGKAVCLDGSSGIQYPTSILNDNASFTISMWAYTKLNLGDEGRLLSTGVWGDNTPGITMGLYSGTDGNSSWAGMTYGMGKEAGTSYYQWSYAVPYDQVYQTWAHITAVFDREENQAKVYINGEEKSRYSLEGYNTDSVMDAFAVGGHLSGDILSSGFVGKIDELILFNKALSGSEVKELSEAENSLKPCRVEFVENGGEQVEDLFVKAGDKIDLRVRTFSWTI